MDANVHPSGRCGGTGHHSRAVFAKPVGHRPPGGHPPGPELPLDLRPACLWTAQHRTKVDRDAGTDDRASVNPFDGNRRLGGPRRQADSRRQGRTDGLVQRIRRTGQAPVHPDPNVGHPLRSGERTCPHLGTKHRPGQKVRLTVRSGVAENGSVRPGADDGNRSEERTIEDRLGGQASRPGQRKSLDRKAVAFSVAGWDGRLPHGPKRSLSRYRGRQHSQ